MVRIVASFAALALAASQPSVGSLSMDEAEAFAANQTRPLFNAWGLAQNKQMVLADGLSNSTNKSYRDSSGGLKSSVQLFKEQVGGFNMFQQSC